MYSSYFRYFHDIETKTIPKAYFSRQFLPKEYQTLTPKISKY